VVALRNILLKKNGYVLEQLYSPLVVHTTSEHEANLVRLNDEAHLDQVTDLIARKLAGQEQSALADGDVAFHRRKYERLVAELEAAYQAIALPEGPSARPALNDLLVRLRLQSR
jgi:uncharacterized protein